MTRKLTATGLAAAQSDTKLSRTSRAGIQKGHHSVSCEHAWADRSDPVVGGGPEEPVLSAPGFGRLRSQFQRSPDLGRPRPQDGAGRQPP